ncbi:MAG: Trp biosynthesis-associated membrane protein [Actinomycetota bacterium]|nr:Trp biosynthesis-associated membrane protein [Actinomycetota bacterium]
MAVVGCVVAAAILLLASGQSWLQVALPARAPLPAARETLTGQEVVDSLVPVGLLVGAAGLALIATRHIGRLVVAGIVVLAGLAVLAAVGFFLYDDGSLQAVQWAQARTGGGESVQANRDVSIGPAVLALLGGLSSVTVGVFTLVRSRSWPVMGARYQRRATSTAPGVADRPGGAHEESSRPQVATNEAAMWAALERGEDPTAVPGLARTTDALETTRDK